MASGFNDGGIKSINRINPGEVDAHIGLQRAGNNTNFYDTSQVSGTSEATKYYQQNWDPSSFSYLSKTNPASVGLNPFRNNFSEMILAYKDDGTTHVGHTIGIA